MFLSFHQKKLVSSQCLQLFYKLLRFLTHEAAMSFDVFGQLIDLLSLAMHLMDHSMGLETIDSKETHSITEDVEVVLVVCLALVEKFDFHFLHSGCFLLVIDYR